MFGSHPEVYGAYCNDNSLIFFATGGQGFVYDLADIPNPPGTDEFGTPCVTRNHTLGGLQTIRIPLNVTLLSTSSQSNNINNGGFPLYDYINTTNGSVGLPSDGNVGWTLAGGEIFPLYSNAGTVV